MSDLQLSSGQRVFYEYDSVQDMLCVLFRQDVGSTYNVDVSDMPGVMLRYATADDKVVGLTVTNVQGKLMQRLITDIGKKVLPDAA